MRFTLPSIKCWAAPPSFRLCYLNCTRRFDLITARSAVVGSWEEPPNIWLTVAKNAFVGWDLNLRVRMLLKGAVNSIQFWSTLIIRHKSQILLIYLFILPKGWLNQLRIRLKNDRPTEWTNQNGRNSIPRVKNSVIMTVSWWLFLFSPKPFLDRWLPYFCKHWLPLNKTARKLLRFSITCGL